MSTKNTRRADRVAVTKHKRVLEICQRTGVHIEKRGAVYHLRGPGIDIKTTDLLSILPDDDLLGRFNMNRKDER